MALASTGFDPHVVHASAVFEPPGRIVVLGEDVGRHNAMDKALGALVMEGRYPVPDAFAGRERLHGISAPAAGEP